MNPTPIKVLLVEDSPSDAELIQEHLGQFEFEQFEITVAERLDEAVARVRQEPFDVLLLDLSLPDSTGRETFLRMQQAAPQVPLVVLTGVGGEM